MERKEVMSVGDVLRECLEQSRMQDRLDEVRACECFPLVVGRELSALCRRPVMRQGTMTISTSNASLRSDLNIRRSRIKAGINEIMGKETVKELKFI